MVALWIELMEKNVAYSLDNLKFQKELNAHKPKA